MGRWWALGAVTLAVLAVGLDITVLSVAVPTLAGALKASESDLQWFSSGYTLVLAAAMLPAGLLGDRYGRKKVMLLSLGLFAAGSLSCAFSRTPTEFIMARVLLGVAGAGITVMAISALTVLFTPEERPRAVGVWAGANMVAFPIGPILGGWLLTHHWWGWVFLMNVPVAVLGLVAVAALVPETSAEVRPGIDAVGILASSAGLVGVTYGFIEAGQHGWSALGTLAPLIGGVVVIVAFFSWERRLGRRAGATPLVDLGLFRSRAFTWGVVLFAVLTLAMIGLLFTMPQYFQGVQGANPEGSGLRLLPVVGGLMVGLPPAVHMAKRIGPKLTIALGFALFGAAVGVLAATTTAATSEGVVAIWTAVAGAGVGITMSTAASAALSELSEERAGIGSGVLQALKNTGAPLGTAVLGSTVSSTYVSHLHLAGLPAAAQGLVRQSVFGGVAVAHALHSAPLLSEVRTAFVRGVDAAMEVSMGIAAVGLALSLAMMPGRRRTAESGAGPRSADEGLDLLDELVLDLEVPGALGHVDDEEQVGDEQRLRRRHG
jgi:MFS transporter, DHA2 family, multidrug resistance protein